MDIFLDAFIDTNFGDNFFVHTVVSRYPKHNFYMIEREMNQESYRLLQETEKNIFLISQNEEDAYINKMDAMLIVGGDMFWDYGDYAGYLKRMHTVKENGGWIAIMGLSLFEKYSDVTKETFKEMFSLTDFIVVRDKETFLQIKKLVPGANVVSSTDMAFTFNAKTVKFADSQKGVLGVAVRRKIPRNTEDRYMQYCKTIAETIVAYLNESNENLIKFLALSIGEFDDRLTVEDIIKLCPEEYRNRIKSVCFEGSIKRFIEEMKKCEKILCTRYHSLVFALILEKPFVPIVYEEKMRRLLKEIGYYGQEPDYEEQWNVHEILQAFSYTNYLKEELEWYNKKSVLFFEELDSRLLPKRKKRFFCRK